jgi:Helix-turn-helix domain
MTDDARIWALHCQGLTVRQIAEQVGKSKSTVGRTIARQNVARAAVNDDGAPDPWDDDDLSPDELALLDTTEERWPAEPLTLVGYERQWFTRGPGNGGYWADVERWVDGNGHSIGDEHESAEMALYRYRMRVANELEDRPRAKSLEADWERQRAAYRVRSRR